MADNWEFIDSHHSLTEDPIMGIFHMHAHECYELYYFLSGDAKYSVEGNFYDLKPGDLLIMRPAEVHSLIIHSKTPYERCVVNFYPQAIIGENADELLRFTKESPLGQYNRFPVSLFKQKNWHYYMEKIHTSKDINEQRLYLTVLINELKESYPEITKRQQKTENFSNILAFINKHITEKISLEDICAFSFLSKSQLNRKFKAITGTTAWEYVTVKRLMLARELLKKHRRPTSVYLECGFGDYSTFFRAYKAQFGTSPAEDFEKITEKTAQIQ